MLSHFIHLTDSLINLFDAGSLFNRGISNLGHDDGNAANRTHNFFHGFPGLGNQFGAVLNLFYRIANQALDFSCGSGGALGKITHFSSHHGKTPPLLTGASRLNSRIKRKNIGLESNAVNHRDDVHNLA